VESIELLTLSEDLVLMKLINWAAQGFKELISYCPRLLITDLIYIRKEFGTELLNEIGESRGY